MKTQTVHGYEWQFEGFGIRLNLLYKTRRLDWFIRRLVRVNGMELLRPPQIIRTEGIGTVWGPGVSGATLITDSSIVLHTCEDTGQVFLDIFSCKKLDKKFLDRYVSDYFRPMWYKSKLTKRGRRGGFRWSAWLGSLLWRRSA